MNNSRTAEPGNVMGKDGVVDFWAYKQVGWSLGRVSVWAGLHKGVFQESVRPSQMKHAELKIRPFLSRVSFDPPVASRRSP